jgi:uncharacterized membrane protein YkoI
LPGGTIQAIEVEDEAGTTVYDVEATDADGILYELEVAEDGTVLEIEIDDDEAEDGTVLEVEIDDDDD